MLRFLCLFVCILLFVAPFVHAQDSNSIDIRIKELSDKITELKGRENTLGKQLVLLDSTIALTTTKIAIIKIAITKLSSEIDELAHEIDRLESLLTKRLQIVIRRIPETYKRQVAPQFGGVFFSQNFSDFVSRIKYMSNLQGQDSQLLFQLKATQEHFGERKTMRESKKAQQLKLQKQLEIEQLDLASQKKEKQILLEQTKNNEAIYQQLLAQALAEKKAIERALTDSVKVGPIKKGDPIALVGNSGYPGCSTGAHLHFEVQRGGTWVNAEEYLSSRDVHDDQNGVRRSIGSGSWDWPIEGDIVVTQHYGKTPYSWRYAYSGGIHTGVDMVSKTSTVIRAPSDGTLYASSQTCGSASIIKIKYIDHGGGLVSFYLHVQ